LIGRRPAHENDAERAARAGLSIQLALVEINRKNAGSGKPHSTRAQLDLGQKDGGDGEIQDR
jgi:hypothetical protein